MSDDSVTVRFVCPQCGQELVGPSGKNEAQLSDTLSCPVHGAIGRFDELVEEAGDAVTGQIGDAMADIFKNAGFGVRKEPG